jgi:hypothetical protein
VFRELLFAPPSSGAFGIALLVSGHTPASVVVLVLTLIMTVQSVIYAPRALRAARRADDHQRAD